MTATYSENERGRWPLRVGGLNSMILTGTGGRVDLVCPYFLVRKLLNELRRTNGLMYHRVSYYSSNKAILPTCTLRSGIGEDVC